MPLRLAVWGLLPALSVIVTVPATAPIAVGLKVTEIKQFFPTATEPPQVFVSAKLALAVMLVINNVALPVLDNEIFFGALVVPTTTPGKISEGGVSTTVCPFRAAVKNKGTSPSRQKMKMCLL